MGSMSREEVIDLLVANMINWPVESSKCVRGAMEYRGSGWVWREGVHGDPYLWRGDGLRVTKESWELCKGVSDVLGNPSAHESVRKQPEWDGEGLPPVGAVVEVLYQEQWQECEVIGHFMQRAAPVAAFTVARKRGLKDLSARRQECFRPIRSDAEKAVDAAMQDIGAEVGDHASIKGVIERMLAAGYRKTEGV